MNRRTALVLHSHPRENSPNRLPALDAIRGLLLTLVLADHIDASTGNNLHVNDWTLMGLGFSDAADGFASISGFVFGYAYRRRLENDGIGVTCWHVFRRMLQIYVGYVFCVIAIRSLRYLVYDHTLWNWEQWERELFLVRLPSNTSILFLYIVTLPWLFVLLLLHKWFHWSILVVISGVVYVVGQFESVQTLQQGYIFQPVCWQFPMVLSAVLGVQASGYGRTVVPRSIQVLSTALIIMAIGLAVQKISCLYPDDWKSHWIFGKSNWGPLRGIHFFSMAYVLYMVVPLSSHFWDASFWNVFKKSGRHSLAVYCVGCLLSVLGGIFWDGFGVSVLTMWLVLVNSLAVQFIVGNILDSAKYGSDSGAPEA